MMSINYSCCSVYYTVKIVASTQAILMCLINTHTFFKIWCLPKGFVSICLTTQLQPIPEDISLYIIKRFRRRRRVKNREGGGGGGGGGGASPQGLIILSPPKAINCLVYSNFGFVRSLDLFELWVCSKFGFVRSWGLFDSTDPGS